LLAQAGCSRGRGDFGRLVLIGTIFLVLFSQAAVARAAPVPIGRISIPRIGIKSMPWYQGASQATLSWGPAHYADTGLPGCGSCTVAIAGHRVTPVPGYGDHGPFRYVDRLRPGDTISLTLTRRHLRYTYNVLSILPQVRPYSDLAAGC
jgi:LPXTG-site transpeptidase (sortase) family protein